MPYIHNVTQGSEDWEQVRKGKATASQFHRIITPKRLSIASGAATYAAELVAERMGVESVDFEPTYWMQWGTECEEHAKAEFSRTFAPVEDVGFVTLDEQSQCGCSPDGFVGDDELIQIKCPKPETLIGYLAENKLPDAYRIQVQGELWVTGRHRSHFYGWHPEIEPFHIVVDRDEKVIAALESAMPSFLQLVDKMCERVRTRSAPSGFEIRKPVEIDWEA